MDEVIGLFPTPLLRCPGTLPPSLAMALAERFETAARQPNSSSEHLSHTLLLKPGDSPLLVEAAAVITPRIVEFGRVLFGERLGWSIKELWVNVLDPGGRQALHNHANSFASGVVYLTPTQEGSTTVFARSPGGHDFAFRNDHPGSEQGPYNSAKWASPAAAPGDLVLFPSWLMHEVPPNRGARRITLALNAIPSRLDSWGYRIGFAG
jgi:hypothetical protein